jgi:acyl-coenzyme A thioesterase PaaI-like protein
VAGFIDATKVAQEADPTSFVAQLDPQWTVFERPHGGYMVAILARAAGVALAEPGHVDPLAVSAHFLSSPVAGAAAVRIEPLRTGRTVSQVRATLLQDGKRCVEALLTMGRIGPAGEPYFTGEEPVAMPGHGDCVTAPNPDGRLGMYQVVDLRLDPANLGYLRGEPDGGGEIRGWLSFVDDTPPDPLNLLYVADALPPASLTINPSGWVPTLELSVYVRARPAPGPLRVRQRTRLIETVTGAGGAAGTGLMDEVCDVWDSRGRLVAQGTQLASVRFTS